MSYKNISSEECSAINCSNCCGPDSIYWILFVQSRQVKNLKILQSMLVSEFIYLLYNPEFCSF